MGLFENEMFFAIAQILERIEIKLINLSNRLEVIEKEIFNLKPHPDKVDIIFYGDEGEIMADLVLGQGGSKVAVLHYLKAGQDLGSVPVADNPTFSTNDPALTITSNADGSVNLGNANSGDADVDVQLTGAAKGFSVVKTVTCTGTGVVPPPQPDAVDIQFQ